LITTVADREVIVESKPEGSFVGTLVPECGNGNASMEKLKRGKLNGASGMSDIEGKATRVGASERGQRTSFKC
jgi:hypothetical protein